MDCSAPTGKGLNKTINKADFPCKFDTVRDVVKVVARTGERSYLAKRDWDGAYRQARVRPKDIRLLGFRFKGWIYYDVALPFGLTSSSAAHNWFAELFESILLQEIDGLLAKHFADDHIFDLGVLDDLATERLRRIDVIAEQLGIAFSLPKNVGPVWILKFVGFILDTDRMEVRIPCAKILEGIAEFDLLLSGKQITVTDLQRVAGKANYFAQVIPVGRTFLGKILALLRHQDAKRRKRGKAKTLHTFRVPAWAKSDALWWRQFLPVYNGRAMIEDIADSRGVVHIVCDSSGFAAGAFLSTEWIHTVWSASDISRATSAGSTKANIAVLEMQIAVMAVLTWAQRLAGRTVPLHSDNKATVAAVHAMKARDQRLMAMCRILYDVETKFAISLEIVHIKGNLNQIADHLSRNRFEAFRRAFRTAFGKSPALGPTGCAKI